MSSNGNVNGNVNGNSDNSYTYHLSLRLERPVADCELQPHAFLTIKGGNMDNVTRGKLMDANQHYFKYKWSRGPKAPTCANPTCPRRNSLDPMLWTKFSRGGPGLHCAICEKLRLPKQDSSFCCINCFQTAWKQHAATKHTSITLTNNSQSNENNDYSEDDTPISLSPQTIITEDEISSYIPISEEKIYVPTKEDVGCTLDVTITAYRISDNQILAGPVSAISEPVLASPSAPPKRQLTMIPGAITGTSTAVAKFRVISYNILSELYATKQAYRYCDSWCLSWAYRRKIIIQELEEAQGDIICLQEIQADHYESYMHPTLSELGYDGMFRQKSRESMGQHGKVDGCAVFWKRNKFALSESYTVDFNDCALRAAMTMGLDDTEGRRYINRLSKDNIAQILLLEVIGARVLPTMSSRGQSKSLICLANTHLYSNHQRPDVKLWQTYALISEIERIIIPRDIPLLLCGDFNSEPDSAVYELLTVGALERPHPELEEKGDSRILPRLHSIIQRMELSSMMSAPTGVEPSFTNYTEKFKGTLDYIFYSPSRLRVLTIASVPSEKDIESTSGEGLPSACYPSDHIHLCCDLALLGQPLGSLLRYNRQSSSQESIGGGGFVDGGNGDSNRSNSKSMRR